MEEGHVLVRSIRQIGIGDVSGELARRSGFDGVIDFLKSAKHGSGRNVYLSNSNIPVPSNRAGPLAASHRRRYPPPAMSVTPEQVRHIANLARLAMSDEELARLVPELNNILGWVEQLGEVDTEGVEPLATVVEQKLRLREDKVTDGNIRDEVLANAPVAEHGFFAVPKVIE
jgi:aspartyl-tRNA(Asn)/glutamyl-tRNA(Gln) amidotransferase subunit C